MNAETQQEAGSNEEPGLQRKSSESDIKWDRLSWGPEHFDSLIVNTLTGTNHHKDLSHPTCIFNKDLHFNFLLKLSIRKMSISSGKTWDILASNKKDHRLYIPVSYMPINSKLIKCSTIVINLSWVLLTATNSQCPTPVTGFLLLLALILVQFYVIHKSMCPHILFFEILWGIKCK